jgi:nicotinate-nucleotide adenylyltransferase
MTRLGILGGTFDPPHIAHLVMADQACGQLRLSRVLFVPAGQPPHKRDRLITSAELRVAMVQLAIAGHAACELSRVDMDRPGPHYTADTLDLIRGTYPDAELYLLVGSDSLRDLLKWHAPARVAAQAHFAVMRRPDAEPDMQALEAAFPGLACRVSWLDAPWLDISSHDIQRRVRAGCSIRYLVPKAVESFIAEQRLYVAE